MDFISTLKLNLTFDTARLQQDLTAVQTAVSRDNRWIEHGNYHIYTGQWDGLALQNTDGAFANIAADPVRGNKFTPTPLLNHCPYISEILANLKCVIGSARFLRLASGAIIGEHIDGGLCYEYGEARIHIPIQTNPDLEFQVNGNRIIMNEGECWYMNANMPHSVANRGETDRIHLVIDLGVNDWVQNQFETALGHPAPPIMKINNPSQS